VIHRVLAGGGASLAQTSLNPARLEISHRWPQVLPDGRSFIYMIRSENPNVSGVYFGWQDKPGEAQRILPAAAKAAYVPPQADRPGYLMWVQSGQIYEGMLLAQRFDSSGPRLAGDPVSNRRRDSARARGWR
jgi:hypothetical protein